MTFKKPKREIVVTGDTIIKRLTPDERDAAREARLAAAVVRAESPLVKFARVWTTP